MIDQIPLSPDLLYTLVFAGLLLTTALFLWAVWELGSAADHRRALAQRSALYEAERRANTPMARLNSRLRTTDAGRQLEQRLIRSGVSMRVGTFAVLLGVAVLITVLLTWNIFGPVFGLLAAGGVVAGFANYLNRQEDRRREEFIGQLPELARVLSNATSAGLALPTAVAMASEELGEPARTELQHMSDSLKFGKPFQVAIAELQERMPSREISVLASTLLVSSRTGGSLVSALRNIAETLEKRKETRREVKTIVAESTSTTWGLAFMGGAALLIVHSMHPGGLREMSSEFVGLAVLAVSGALFAAGILLVRRITHIRF